MNDQAPSKDIVHPEYLDVQFENQGGDWIVRIPGAFKGDADFVAPLNERMILQFKPIKMTNLITQQRTVGVGCIPILLEEEEEDSDATPTD